ncbi:hypothetical protein RSOL_324200 [Rhizoctonia solani AG-3 Rhs1AP]|uniref:Uncharacterized protein n=2 Tax=Rhizoctonia solani AG-3 TaxID=1086053 RepID=A0A074RYM1_9AGAM|nr:hypothetical protein RSOL_324200 [Rhizoctonia solani AG-3 Rhs1AP]KEP52099.1 hypothetical protein V565_050540 [Rhizoctonia solani 123E]
MNVTTHIVAPRIHFPRSAELTGALDRLFRQHRVPPAIVQHSFVDRRPANHYSELLYILTPFPIRPTSELLEDIGHAVAPAQARFTTLLSSHYPPACPDKPNTATLTISCPTVTLHHRVDSHRHSYALHSLSVTARQEPNASAGCTITPHFAPRDPRFERTCNGLRHECTWIWEVLDKQLRANGFAEYADREAPATAAGESGNATNGDTESPVTHVYCHRPPISSAPPNGFPTSCSSQPPTENIVINVPISSTSTAPPLCITFTATLTSAAGLDAIDATHRTSQWADPQALEGLQNAFDKAHPAVQVVHHVVRVEIPDVGEMIRTGLGCGGSKYPSTDAEVERLEGPGFGVYAQRRRGASYFGELLFTLDRDAGVAGRRGDEDEEDNSDEEEL